MNRNLWLLTGVVVILGLVVAFGLWLREEPLVATAGPETPGSTVAGMASADAVPADLTAIPSPATREDVPLLPLPEVPAQVDAVESLRRARLQGDERAPAVVRGEERVPPTAAELADPEAYQRYEARQNERLYRSYIKSADSEIPQLQEQIAKAKASGMSPEQLAEGEEKLRRIEAMRNQLMSDHPELNRPATP